MYYKIHTEQLYWSNKFTTGMNLDWISFHIISYYFSLFKILVLILHCHLNQWHTYYAKFIYLIGHPVDIVRVFYCECR
jgi:hypothetical protein